MLIDNKFYVLRDNRHWTFEMSSNQFRCAWDEHPQVTNTGGWSNSVAAAYNDANAALELAGLGNCHFTPMTDDNEKQKKKDG